MTNLLAAPSISGSQSGVKLRIQSTAFLVPSSVFKILFKYSELTFGKYCAEVTEISKAKMTKSFLKKRI